MPLGAVRTTGVYTRAHKRPVCRVRSARNVASTHRDQSRLSRKSARLVGASVLQCNFRSDRWDPETEKNVPLVPLVKSPLITRCTVSAINEPRSLGLLVKHRAARHYSNLTRRASLPSFVKMPAYDVGYSSRSANCFCSIITRARYYEPTPVSSRSLEP